MKKLILLLGLILFLAGCQQVEHTDMQTLEKFKSFIDKDNLEYVADYEVSASGNTYNMKQYLLDENNIRTDLEISGNKASTYILDKNLYTCTKKDEWICIEIKDKKLESATQFLEKVEKNPENYLIKFEGTDTIAGTEVFCFAIKMPEMMGLEMKECFTVEGVPLYLSTGSLMEMTAKSYSLDVKEKDFELPADPIPLEEYMGEDFDLDAKIEEEAQNLR